MVTEVARYWASKCDSRAMPTTSDIDLLDLHDLTPYLLLADIKANPFSVRYRMVGPQVVRHSFRDFTGEEAGSLRDNPHSLDWRSVYASLVDTRQPVYGHNIIPTIENRNVAYAFGVFPLSDENGDIVRGLGVEDYRNLAPYDRAFAEGEVLIGTDLRVKSS